MKNFFNNNISYFNSITSCVFQIFPWHWNISTP